MDSQETTVVDLKSRVEQVLAKEVAPALGMDSTSLEVIEVNEGVDRIRLSGGCGCCPSSIMTIIHGIEQELRRRLPEIDFVELTGFP
jgi:Fe-S cluster biogenesis protein NfuA